MKDVPGFAEVERVIGPVPPGRFMVIQSLHMNRTSDDSDGFPPRVDVTITLTSPHEPTHVLRVTGYGITDLYCEGLGNLGDWAEGLWATPYRDKRDPHIKWELRDHGSGVLSLHAKELRIDLLTALGS